MTSPAWIRSAVRALTAYTPGEQPTDAGVIKLNTNENPYPPSPAVAAAAHRLALEDLRLYPDPLSVELRAAIARRHGCRVEQVFAGNGSDEVLALCTRAFVEPDGVIGFFEPSYSLYPVLAAIQGVATRPVPLNPDFSWRQPPRTWFSSPAPTRRPAASTRAPPCGPSAKYSPAWWWWTRRTWISRITTARTWRSACPMC